MEIPTWLFLLLSKFLDVQVEVSEGIVKGTLSANSFGSPFYSFKGIPYAEPPIGDFRFKAPQPKKTWEGIFDATKHGPICYQYDVGIKNPTAVGSEDCLYINVYSPNIKPVQPFPVMVFVHGGGFIGGSGNDDEYGPELLIRKGDVIVVTFNYRLGILGFLSLENKDIPGNAGMKDQVAALRWIKKNIKAFGGDPENITIFGESAGGASVSFHLVSPMSKGLFKRAIVQSGALTSQWPNTFKARERALVLARQLGSTSNDDKEIYEFLKAQPVENLINTPIIVTFAQMTKESPNVYYGIIREKDFGEERFFYGSPYEVLRNGIHKGVDVMNGYTEDEGVLYFSYGIDADNVFYQANRFLEFFVPEPYTTDVSLDKQMEIGKRFKNFYMKNKTASRDTLDDLLKYFNMDNFVYGTIAFQKIIAKNVNVNTYLYKFTCKSELNLYTNLTGLEELFSYRPVVAHADDLGYMFPFPYKSFGIEVRPETFKMVEQVTALWTNFAKYGDPTPDNNSLNVKWKPYTLENQDYLDIGEELVPKQFPEKDDVEFWEKNFREFLPDYLP